MRSQANGQGASNSQGPFIPLHLRHQQQYAEWKAAAETSIWTVMP
jgi:hypothetical protein